MKQRHFDHSFESLTSEKLYAFQQEMKTIGFVGVNENLAHVCGKLGFEIKIGPSSKNKRVLEVGPWIHHMTYTIVDSLVCNNLTNNIYFDKFCKKQKHYRLYDTLESIYRLAGKEAVVNFVIAELEKFGYNKA